jgi:hypothetical protein
VAPSIDRAGRLLAEHLAETPANVDAEVLDAMDILADYRDAHRVALLSTVGVLHDAIGDDVDAVATAYRYEIVLLGADSIQALHITHAHYFTPNGDLARVLARD